ncbi:outer membrane beta-barrel protein [Colwellia echini]|uniref:Porin family protein n=1 Tax=Colwellia echini TaxID=1982103 RepID=A0ABY3N1G0_9GAMM|nr:outer membrane beta-barrel protein [Colwellia echini]TYK67259.1 porin family protein [Colwellia echini]
MKTTASLIVLLISISFPSFANSADSYSVDSYLGIDYVYSDIEFTDERTNPNSIAVRAGFSISRIGLEAQYLQATNTDNIYRLTFDLEQSAALYLLMKSKVYNGYGVDVLAGYASTKMLVTGSGNPYNEEDTYQGLSWGVAIHKEIPYFEQAKIRLGYQSLYRDDYMEITAISLGVMYQF